ncbi:hypothetical protein LPB41_20375 [Thalassospira sp. MA62]|nr:hypothetical protein [Thalassospira sp. MA62]
MFVDNPFWLASLVSAVIAAVLMLALWLGLDRAIARRVVLAAVIPAVAIAIPSAIGLPETARGGVGAALLMLVLGGVCGVILDFARISERVCLVIAALLLLLGAWLVLAAPINGLAGHATGIKALSWIAYLGAGGCFLWVTRPDFTEDTDEDAPSGKGRKTKGGKAAGAKSKAKAKPVEIDPVTAAKPSPVAILTTLSVGLGIIAAQFHMRDQVIFLAALAVALIVALVSEKAAPQYRAAVWLAVVSALMTGAASVILQVPATGFAIAVLLLVVSSGRAATRLSDYLSAENPAQTALLGGLIRLAVLGLPLVMAALVAYVGAEMAVTLY